MRPHSLTRSICLLALLLAAVPGLAAAAVRVFVTVQPQAWLAERVGGEAVVVETLVAAGQSPHTFEPRPQQVEQLMKADLFWRTGMPFEDAWLSKIQATNPRMTVLDARDGIALLPEADHAHEDGHAHGGGDPHIWTSPRVAKRMAAGLAQTLARIDPASTGRYAANLAGLAAELDALDREIASALEPLRGRRFLVFHPAWGYFADAYGLEQVAVERGGKEPGPKALAQLADDARRSGIRAVFVQPQFSRRTAETLAAAIGGRVVALDPLSKDYPSSLRAAAHALAEDQPR
jgi:zinc transport system substrate-binding protein